MKTWLIRMVVSPNSLFYIMTFCVFALIFLHFPVNIMTSSADNNDEFPGQRQGGGTHWPSLIDHTA